MTVTARRVRQVRVLLSRLVDQSGASIRAVGSENFEVLSRIPQCVQLVLSEQQHKPCETILQVVGLHSFGYTALYG